jgi:hypothetical protein
MGTLVLAFARCCRYSPEEMHPRTRAFRLGWLIAALFQLLLPTFASVADARAEAASIRYASLEHVESTGASGCPRVHPADCVVCQALATGARIVRPVSIQVATERVIAARTERWDRVARSATAPGDPPQRAPPALS